LADHPELVTITVDGKEARVPAGTWTSLPSTVIVTSSG